MSDTQFNILLQAITDLNDRFTSAIAEIRADIKEMKADIAFLKEGVAELKKEDINIRTHFDKRLDEQNLFLSETLTDISDQLIEFVRQHPGKGFKFLKT